MGVVDGNHRSTWWPLGPSLLCSKELLWLVAWAGDRWGMMFFLECAAENSPDRNSCFACHAQSCWWDNWLTPLHFGICRPACLRSLSHPSSSPWHSGLVSLVSNGITDPFQAYSQLPGAWLIPLQFAYFHHVPVQAGFSGSRSNLRAAELKEKLQCVWDCCSSLPGYTYLSVFP